MDKKVIKAITLIVQLGIYMVVPIVLCLFVGIALDRWLGTSPWLLIIFVIMGIGAGFKNVYRATKDFYEGEDTYIDMSKYRGKDDKRVEK